MPELKSKEGFALIISVLLLTDLTIFLNIPVLRQILGVLCYALLPGMLILFILKLHKIAFLKKAVLACGLSLTFSIFFGMLINNLYYSLGYSTPLSTTSLVVSFSAIIILFAVIGYKINREAFSFDTPDFKLTSAEKAFLIVPVILPPFTIFGTYIMNISSNNIVLLFILFLIPCYVVFISILNQKIPKRIYPITIFMISLSLVLLNALRSNHIWGCDVHTEYYLFQMNFQNLHWSIMQETGAGTLNACLVDTILPAIYQSILNVSNEEYFFRLFFPLIVSTIPLIIYILFKKYVGDYYAFLASFFFMCQKTFLRTEANPRTVMAILFVALAIMVFFSADIKGIAKRFLFIAFIMSIIISHYSTSYEFFFVMIISMILMNLFERRFNLKSENKITLTMNSLFFASMFFWYSQIVEETFINAVSWISNVFRSLTEFYIVESRASQALFSEDIAYKGIPHKIEFIATWMVLILIAIGLITIIIKYKKMVSVPGFEYSKVNFLKTKFETEFLAMTLAFGGLLLVSVAVPHLDYSSIRVFIFTVIILSGSLIVGGITTSKFLKVPRYLVIVLVLTLFFLSTTGWTYHICGISREFPLSSEGEAYEGSYIHDQESVAAKWLRNYGEKDLKIYSDVPGTLISQGLISWGRICRIDLISKSKKGEYAYFRYHNVVDGKIRASGQEHNLTEWEFYPQILEKNKIYCNGGSEVYI